MGGKSKRNKAKSHTDSSNRKLSRSESHAVDRQTRNALKKRRQKQGYIQDDDDDRKLEAQLNKEGYQLKDMRGDGNCLFRSLADQYWHDDTRHLQARREVCQHLRDNQEQYAPFIDVDEWGSFAEYVDDLSKPKTFADNDAIVAFSRLYNVDVEIHQLDQPRFRIEAVFGQPAAQCLHIALHSYEHYSSVVALAGFQQQIQAEIAVVDQSPDQTSSHQDIEEETLSRNQLKKLRRQQRKQARTQSLINKKQNNSQTPKSNHQSSPEELTPSVENVPLQVEHDEHSGDEQKIMMATGCKDIDKVREAFCDSGGDVDMTIAFLLQTACLLEDLPPSPQPSAQSVEETSQNTASPTASSEDKVQDSASSSKKMKKERPLTSRQRKELAKREKILRKQKERAAQLSETNPQSKPKDGQETTVVTI